MRSRSPVFAACIVATSLTASWPVFAADPTPVPLIERAKLFGNPSKTGGQLSPDGKWISFIAPRDGVLNVWVGPASDPSVAKPMTAEKARPISSIPRLPLYRVGGYANVADAYRSRQR